jgi:5,5'-dehydrodivanillate O-demethylase oxygenase subunit
MLTEAENQLLTRVGPGTRMGALLRRYWHPIAGVLEMESEPTKPVRLLGEDLVLYRDRKGGYGLVDRRCPHRGADLLYGIVEPNGLRCSYHGWCFDARGRCLEQPFEEALRPDGAGRDKVVIKAYPVEEKAGLVWAYLGPAPAPCLWDWARFHDPGQAYVTFTRIPCNWLQCQENSIDPVHFEWLHQNLPSARFGDGARAPRHLRLGFDEFEFGFVYRRILENTDESHPLWSVGRVSLWPECLYTGGFVWHVPMDDETTMDVTWDTTDATSSEKVHVRHLGLARGRDGRYRIDDSQHQDAVAMIGQGTIADRGRERLGESDRGVIMLRRRLLAELDALEDGRDPKGVLRDVSRNHRLPLPRAPKTPEQKNGPRPDGGRLSALRQVARGLVGKAEAPARAVVRRLRGLAQRDGGPDLGQMIQGYRSTALVYIVAKLGVADALAGGPRRAEDLARDVGAHADSLARILRALAAHGLFEERGGRFALTAAGERLRSGVPGSMRGAALLAGEEYLPAWRGLLHTALTGETAFDHVFQMSAWEHRRSSPELNAAFNEMIASGAAWCAERAAAGYDFSRFRRVADVGGGTGAFLGNLLRREAALRGTLLDQPHVVEAAPAVLAGLGVTDRCDIVPGDFFSAVPEGADAYLLKNVLHDWDDERAAEILRVCRRGMRADARLLVVESVLPAEASGAPGSILSDIHMLAVDGGRERDEAGYRGLLERAGLALLRTVPIAREVSLLEARPR